MLKLIKTSSTNPFFNLAVENFLLGNDTKHKCLYLWRNDPTVVIGKYQNAFLECDVSAMHKDQVNLARRTSGGGAVYQDLGNLNFTFISPTRSFSKENNNKIVINSLKHFDVNAEVSGRNDITVNGAKVSGAAFKQGPRTSFHHGTLLVDVDMNNLSRFLKPSAAKLAGKSVASVRSRVENLKTFSPSITVEETSDALSQEFAKFYKVPYSKVKQIDSSVYEKNKQVKAIYKQLTSYDWIFGKIPKFSTKSDVVGFSWGTVQVGLEISKGKIATIEIFSDMMYTDVIPTIQSALNGVKFTKETISKQCDTLVKKEEDELKRKCIRDVFDIVENLCIQ
ncbi:hypothetical protein GEMRC1_011627 [Eukaryota sp. GEM-RC1]